MEKLNNSKRSAFCELKMHAIDDFSGNCSKEKPYYRGPMVAGWGHKKIAHGQYGRRPNKYYWVGKRESRFDKNYNIFKDVSSILKVFGGLELITKITYDGKQF